MERFDDLRQFVRDAGKDLDRLIVVRPRSEDDGSYVERLFDRVARDVPPALASWEDEVDSRCADYRAEWAGAAIVEIDLKIAVFVFDRTFERVLLAYGISSPQLNSRDGNRMRRFPDVNVGVRKVMGDDAFVCDRGHFLGHAAGGDLDINLFPQRRALNRGWSEEGKRFRRMERHVAAHPDCFFYHRALYDDETWIPSTLEFGVLVDDVEWWVETFGNKRPHA